MIQFGGSKLQCKGVARHCTRNSIQPSTVMIGAHAASCLVDGWYHTTKVIVVLVSYQRGLKATYNSTHDVKTWQQLSKGHSGTCLCKAVVDCWAWRTNSKGSRGHLPTCFPQDQFYRVFVTSLLTDCALQETTPVLLFRYVEHAPLIQVLLFFWCRIYIAPR